MNKIIKKTLAVSLLLVFVLSSISISFNTNNVSYAKEKEQLSLSTNKVVTGNSVYITDFTNKDINENSYIVYSDKKGNEIKFKSTLNDDNGVYFFDIKINEPGKWSIKEHNLNNIGEKNNFDIVVYNNLNEMTGQNEGYIDIAGNLDNLTGENFEKEITNVKGLNSKGEYAEVEISVDEYIYDVYYDGISSSVSIPEDINLTPGKYEIIYSVDNTSITKNINLKSAYSSSKEDISKETNLSSIDGRTSLSSTDLKRYSGQDRYETAVEISKSKFKNSESVVLVNGNNENEILSASSLSGQLEAPILLTTFDTLNKNAKSEINRLGAKKIYIIGDINNICRSIENDFIREGKIVQRLTGKDIYNTAITIAKLTNKENKIDTVILSSAVSVVDSLSAAALSASKGYPILYTDKDNIPSSTLNYLKSSSYKNVVLVGGAATITNNVENSLKNNSFTVSRVWGKDRCETSTTLAEKYFSDSVTVNIASGIAYVDALSGAAVAGINNSPVLLTVGDYVSTDMNKYIASTGAKNIAIYGGAASVSSIFENNLSAMLNGNGENTENDNQNNGNNNGSKVRILLDPGHGAGSAHNRGYVGPRWKNEGDGNYYFSLLVKKELEAYGIEVGTTRTNVNDDPDLFPRGYAGEGYDLFISLHTNAANGKAQGVEIYEDIDRGATQLINNLTNTVSTTLGNPNRGLKRRVAGENNLGIDPKSNYYAVLRANKAKAGMLIEHCFHDTMEDVIRYETNAEVLAKNMAKTIAQYYGLI